MSSRPLRLCPLLLSLLVGCTATTAPRPQGPEASRPRREATTTPGPATRVPRAAHDGPAMSLKVWKVQCADGDLAMMCRRSDPTDRRCAYRRSGTYRWIYGSYCKRSLPCSRRACP